MIKIENTEVLGWEATIRGMRNPMNSWEKSDSKFVDHEYEGDYRYHTLQFGMGMDDDGWDYIDGGSDEGKDLLQENTAIIGPNDHKLMMNLAKAGSVDAKYRRMIVVYADITAPLYWWKEFDTYKVGTVANSCSTMHKIHSKEFTLDDFSCEHLMMVEDYRDDLPALKENEIRIVGDFKLALETTIHALNDARELYLETKDKCFWWQMIQLLPSSYNQRRTVMLNYEVLAGIYPKRKDHKLDEWHNFCDWIKSLPYSEIITLEE